VKTERQTLFVDRQRLGFRVCINQKYGCQHEDLRNRMFRRAGNIRIPIGWKLDKANPQSGKPKGMH
jgi:hypothetical protein